MLRHRAAVDADLLAARVGCVASISDESIRDTFDLIGALQATFVSPQLPSFMMCGIVCYSLLADTYCVGLGGYSLHSARMSYCSFLIPVSRLVTVYLELLKLQES